MYLVNGDNSSRICRWRVNVAGNGTYLAMNRHMQQRPALNHLFLTLFFLILFISSGCSVKDNLTWLDNGIFSPEEASMAEQDPDLQPVAVESEICLDQELEALASTGTWESPQTPHLTTAPEAQKPAEIQYDFPVVVNRQVEMYLDLFQGKLRPYFSQWLSRSGRYLPMIHAELEAAGLPLDLAYLSMIESGFSQRALSRAKAVGLWQFMAGTGRDYGLSVSRYLDERRDAEKSTRAAVSYLKHLYNEFGDWYLAVAAYNGGPGTMRNAMKKTGCADFWRIAQSNHLHLETKRYVPKLIAAIIISKDPERYGFTNIAYEPPLTYETLAVGPGLDFQAAALLTGSDTSLLKQLNQELLSGKTPLDCEQYELKIPRGTRELAERNLPRLHTVASTDYKTHIVQKNETLSQICRTYNINTTTLLKVNNLTSSKLQIGKRLRIPYRTIAYRLLPEGIDPRSAAGDALVMHTVKRGETVSKISRQYQVPPELIVSWNGLSSMHQITAGQQLALYLGVSDAGSGAQEVQSASRDDRVDEARVMILAANKKLPPGQEKPVDSARWYEVRNGDSLWTIARRFNTSPNDIKKWNNLKSNVIHPGHRLKLIDV
jgi:membrane-bound lytic murein transglycosylase D